MKLLKKILAVFTFLFVFTVMAVKIGVNADSEQISFTYNAFTNTLKTESGGNTNVTNVSKAPLTGWYNPSEVSGVSIPSQYYVSYAQSSSGVITKIGNNVAATVANLNAKYKTNIMINAANTVGYVCEMLPISGLNSISFSIGNEKSNAGETFVLISSDGENYYQYGEVEETSNLNLSKTITLSQFNSALSAASGNDCSSNTSMGYAVLLTSSANIYTSSSSGWTTTYSKNIEVTSSFYDVHFMDSDRTTELSTNNVESGKTVSKPSDPIKYGYDFNKWVDEDGSPFDFDEAITGETNVYATYTPWASSVYEDGKTLSLDFIEKLYDTFGNTAVSDSKDTTLTNTIYTLLMGGTRFDAAASTVGEIGTSVAAINTGGGFSSSNIKNGIRIQPTNNGILSMYVYYSADRACNMLRQDGTKYTEIAAGQSTGEKTMTLVTYPLEAGKTYNFGSNDGSIYIYYAKFENAISTDATLNGGTSFGTSTVDGTKAVRFIGSLVKEGITASDITSVSATISISESEKAATVKNVTTTVDTSIGTLAAEAENTLYFYTSVYGFENTNYDTRVLTVVFNVTFTDGSTISKTLTYTINYAEM